MDYRENQDDIVKGVYINIFIVVPTVSNIFFFFLTFANQTIEKTKMTLKGKE